MDPNEQGADTVELQDAAPEVVTRARELGWKPQDEWRGAPPKHGFMSAEDFVRKGEEVLPVVRSQLEKEREKNIKLAGEFDTYRRSSQESLKNLERMSKVALETQRKQIEDRFSDLKEAAVEVGDKDAYRKHDRAEKDALADIDKRLEPSEEERQVTKATAQQLPQAVQETIESWKTDNPWYVDNDPSDEMSTLANSYHLKLQREKKGLTLAQNLAEVSKYVRKRFPEQFGEDAADGETRQERSGSRVEGGSRGGGSAGKSLYSKLPADAKVQADRFIKEDGLFLERGETADKNINQARERYAKQYLGDAA